MTGNVSQHLLFKLLLPLLLLHTDGCDLSCGIQVSACKCLEQVPACRQKCKLPAGLVHVDMAVYLHYAHLMTEVNTSNKLMEQPQCIGLCHAGLLVNCLMPVNIVCQITANSKLTDNG